MSPDSVPGRLLEALDARPTTVVQAWTDPDGNHRTRTRADLRDAILALAAGLRGAGVGPGDRVGLVADNGPRWLEADLAIQACGAIPVPRGATTPPPELAGILAHAEVRLVIAIGDAATTRLAEAAGSAPGAPRGLRLDGPDGDALVAGGPVAASTLPAVGPEDPAALIYTSGTTGAPKGVTLLHRNFLHQLERLPAGLDFRADDVFLAMLPPWHVFERIVEYVATIVGGAVHLADPRSLRTDLPRVRPTWMATVPRIWESLLAATAPARRRAGSPEAAGAVLRAALGGRLRRAVSGGGRLPAAVERTYREAGVGMLIGYGLTETAPVLTVQRPSESRPGSLGRPIDDTEIEIRDRETGAVCTPGQVGVVFARGPQVMRGYWKDAAATLAVLDGDGWLDTGDLAAWTPEGELEFHGRAKATIVLRGGENVEPGRIEERLRTCDWVEQVIVVGNDRKTLAALVVPRPEGIAAALGEVPGRDALEAALRQQFRELLTEAAGFAAWERPGAVAVLDSPFTPENGLLTATLKIRRDAVVTRYADRIAALYGDGG